MNKEYNGNALTKSLIEKLRCDLQFFEEDTNTKGIFLNGNNDFFSRGSDYLLLAHLNLEGKQGTEEYLASLYDLMYYVGRMETPFMPVIRGKAIGSAACLASLATFTLATPQASMAFPETSFGFIPTGGASYHLSRLPGELGMYLALTGKRLSGSDAIHTNFAYRLSDVSTEFIHDLNAQAGDLPQPLDSNALYGDDFNRWRADKIKWEYTIRHDNRNEIMNRTNMGNYWKENRENAKMVYADVLHMMNMRKDSEKEAPYRSWRHHLGQPAQNYLGDFEAAGIGRMIFMQPVGFRYHDARKPIYRCFTANTLEEAIERIKRELTIGDKLWAQETLDLLASKSPLALELTFKLIKEARELQWTDCMKREFVVASRLAKHPDFHEGAVKLLSRYSGIPVWSVNFPVPKDLITQMFTEETPLVLEGSKPNQLLPVKEWYKDFPGAPRYWLNEISTDSFWLRKSFDDDVKNFMRDFDVDVRDPNVDAGKVREAFYFAEMYQKKIDEELDRVSRISEDPVARQIYLTERREAVEEMFANEKQISEKINKLVTKRFEKKILERIELIKKKSSEARFIEKQEFYRETKDYIHRKRFMVDKVDEIGFEKLSMEIEQDNEFPLHIPKDISVSYLDELKARIPAQVEVDPDLVKYTNLKTISDYKSYYALFQPRYLEKSIEPSLIDTMQDLWKALEESTQEEAAASNPQQSLAPPESLNYDKLPSKLHKELQREIFIKTGQNDIDQGIKAIRGHNFTINREEMKIRRIQAIREDLKADDYLYHENQNKLRLKNIFSEFYIKPDLDDLDKSILEVLELESLKQVLSDVEKLKRRRFGGPSQQEENDAKDDLELSAEYRAQCVLLEDSAEKKEMPDIANRIVLDNVYLNAILGTRSYLPLHLTLTKENMKDPNEMMGLYDFSQSPKEWAEKALEQAIDDIFEERANLEINLTRQELIAFDKITEERLRVSNIKRDVLIQLSQEAGIISKGFDFANEGAQEKANGPRKSKTLYNLQNKVIKNMEMTKLKEAHRLEKEYINTTLKGKEKPVDHDNFVLEDMYKKFLRYDETHGRQKGTVGNISYYRKLWDAKAFVPMKERKKIYTVYKRLLQQKERDMQDSTVIMKSIEKLMKSEKVRSMISENDLSIQS